MKYSDADLPSNKSFGLFFAVIFMAIAAYFLYDDASNVAVLFASLSIITGVLALVRPETLLPFNKLWMRFGLLLGMIVSPIVLGLIFFLIFTPVGLLMRMVGRDELRLKPGNKSSYWKEREPGNRPEESFKYQF